MVRRQTGACKIGVIHKEVSLKHTSKPFPTNPTLKEEAHYPVTQKRKKEKENIHNFIIYIFGSFINI